MIPTPIARTFARVCDIADNDASTNPWRQLIVILLRPFPSVLALLLILLPAPAWSGSTVQWPAETTLHVTADTRLDLRREERLIRLERGIVEIVAQGAAVTVDTGRFNATVESGDAWVRVDGERATIWLKQGRAYIEHPTSGRIEMTVPMSFIEARGKTVPSPPLPVSRARADAWSSLTGAQPVVSPVTAPQPPPAPVISGPWSIQVASLAEREQAERLREQLAQAGIDAQVVTTEVDATTHYRVRINGFPSREAARAFAQEKADILRTDSPWITCSGRCETP